MFTVTRYAAAEATVRQSLVRPSRALSEDGVQGAPVILSTVHDIARLRLGK